MPTFSQGTQSQIIFKLKFCNYPFIWDLLYQKVGVFSKKPEKDKSREKKPNLILVFLFLKLEIRWFCEVMSPT